LLIRKLLYFFIVLAASPAAAATFEISSNDGVTLQASTVVEFDEPWAMTFLPDGTMLVTTKPGKLFHVTQDGDKTEVEGIWEVAYGGQGGLGEVVLHPQFAQNGLVYISSAETTPSWIDRLLSWMESALDRYVVSTRGAIVARAKFDRSSDAPRLTNVERIWTQEPKVSGGGHYSHRIAFGPDGMLFITSGDRQKMTPAQDFDTALGKIIRLHDDGSVPQDNPWQDKGDLAKTFWSMGHRNLLGISFDSEGRLWAHEMGPRHGDELNLIEKGGNYGWPLVSNGDHYSGEPIPDHDTRPEFNAPKAFWVPAISPAGFIIYDGDIFPDWHGDGFIGGLSSEALVRVDIAGDSAKEAERFEWDERIREVEEGPDGALWVLEDGSDARMLKLTPKN
jgi:glucose/arabinose dehydrogenase